MPHVLARDILLHQVGDAGDTEGVRRVGEGCLEVSEPAFHHAADVADVDDPPREPALFSEGALMHPNQTPVDLLLMSKGCRDSQAGRRGFESRLRLQKSFHIIALDGIDR